MGILHSRLEACGFVEMIVNIDIGVKVKRYDNLVKIGELAQRTNVPARLLRYYEAQRLLEPTRGENSYRDYPESAINRVLQIRGLLEAGFPTEIIRDILPCLDHTPNIHLKRLRPEVRQRLTAVRDRLDARIGCLERNRDAISAYLAAVG